MNLVEQLQTELLDETSSVAGILRKARVLAFKLKSPIMSNWVNNELNGYSDESPPSVPDYRKELASNWLRFYGPAGTQGTISFPATQLPEPARSFGQYLYILESVSSIAEILTSSSTQSTFQMLWPAELFPQIKTIITPHYNVLSAYKLVGRGTLAGVLDAVRTRLLGFLLELQSTSPEVVASDAALQSVPTARVDEAVNTFLILGGHHTFNVAATINQQGITPGDVVALIREVRALGVGDDDATHLEAAVKDDQAEVQGLGPRTATWLKELTVKFAAKAGEAAPAAISALVLHHFGMQ